MSQIERDPQQGDPAAGQQGPTGTEPEAGDSQLNAPPEPGSSSGGVGLNNKSTEQGPRSPAGTGQPGAGSQPRPDPFSQEGSALPLVTPAVRRQPERTEPAGDTPSSEQLVSDGGEPDAQQAATPNTTGQRDGFPAQAARLPANAPAPEQVLAAEANTPAEPGRPVDPGADTGRDSEQADPPGPAATEVFRRGQVQAPGAPADHQPATIHEEPDDPAQSATEKTPETTKDSGETVVIPDQRETEQALTRTNPGHAVGEGASDKEEKPTVDKPATDVASTAQSTTPRAQANVPPGNDAEDNHSTTQPVPPQSPDAPDTSGQGGKGPGEPDKPGTTFGDSGEPHGDRPNPYNPYDPAGFDRMSIGELVRAEGRLSNIISAKILENAKPAIIKGLEERRRILERYTSNRLLELSAQQRRQSGLIPRIRGVPQAPDQDIEYPMETESIDRLQALADDAFEEMNIRRQAQLQRYSQRLPKLHGENLFPLDRHVLQTVGYVHPSVIVDKENWDKYNKDGSYQRYEASIRVYNALIARGLILADMGSFFPDWKSTPLRKNPYLHNPQDNTNPDDNYYLSHAFGETREVRAPNGMLLGTVNHRQLFLLGAHDIRQSYLKSMQELERQAEGYKLQAEAKANTSHLGHLHPKALIYNRKAMEKETVANTHKNAISALDKMITNIQNNSGDDDPFDFYT